ncbi:hypothetical protein ACFV1L_24970 [Kitasatospora sp. NPDC059646]|uniref:hypothetical protein n=1 Tax=Kitasatospora sp. NPDC059646 TaxID=3346893 RepID=UPI003694276F
MAEQYVTAFAVDAALLLRLPGSGGPGLPGVPPSAALTELLSGRLRAGADSRYTALLPALAGTLGTPLGEVVLPGRHWDELTGVFRALRLPALATLWSRRWPWPDGATDDGPWPCPTLTPHAALPAVLADLDALDPGALPDHPTDHLEDEDLEDAAWFLSEHLPTWASHAHTQALDLLLLRDGAR